MTTTVAAKPKFPAKTRGRSPKADANRFAKTMMPHVGLGVAAGGKQAQEALSAAQEKAAGQAQQAQTPPEAETPARATPDAVVPTSFSGGTPGRGRSRRDRRQRRNDHSFKPITGRPVSARTEEPGNVELPEGEEVPMEELPTEETPEIERLATETPAIEPPLPEPPLSEPPTTEPPTTEPLMTEPLLSKPSSQLEPTPPVQEVPIDPADDGRWPAPRHVRVRIAAPATGRQEWFVEHPGAVEIYGLLLSRIAFPLEVIGTTVGGQHVWEQQQCVIAGDLLVGIDSDDVSQRSVGRVVARLRRSPRTLTFCRSIVNHLRIVREQLRIACGSGVPVANAWVQPRRDVLPTQPVPEGWRAVGVRSNCPLDLQLEVKAVELPPVVVELVGPRAGFWKDHGVVVGDFLVKANGVALSGHSLGHVHGILQKRPLHLLFQNQNSFHKDLGHFGLSGVIGGDAPTSALLLQHQRQPQPQQQQQQHEQPRQHEQPHEQQQNPVSVLHQVNVAYAASLDKCMKEQAEANAKILDEQVHCREKAMQIAWEAHNDVRRQREGLLLQEQQKAQNRVATLLHQDVSATPQHLTNLASAVARTQQLEAAARGTLESVVRRRFEDALRGASEAVEAASLGSGVNEAMRIMEERRLGTK